MAKKPLFYLFIFCFVWLDILAQKPIENKQVTNRILFIYDASNSMNAKWQSGTKNDVAIQLISKALDSLKGNPNVELALRVYGHQHDYRKGQICEDTQLEVPFGKYNVETIKSKLKSIRAQGTTPIALTLEKSEGDFPPCANCRNIIVLITDGIEECGGDPCAVSRALQSKGIVLKPFVIGIGLDPNFMKTFECIGNYFDATDEKTFTNVLGIVISQALNNTSAQVNLLDVNQKPNETDVNMTFTNMYTQKIIYNFIHALNSKGLPDTLKLDPLHTYSIKVHTIPPVTKDSVTITPGIHNIIGIPTPQGFLDIKMGGLNRNTFEVIVRKASENQTLHVQKTNTTEKYLLGKYDLEVLSYPRIYFEDVEILQNHTTTIELPSPGIITVLRSTKGRTDIYKEENNQLTWIYQLGENTKSENLYLQPGSYRAIHKPKSAQSSAFTAEEKFKIKSGASTLIRF